MRAPIFHGVTRQRGWVVDHVSNATDELVDLISAPLDARAEVAEELDGGGHLCPCEGVVHRGEHRLAETRGQALEEALEGVLHHAASIHPSSRASWRRM